MRPAIRQGALAVGALGLLLATGIARPALAKDRCFYRGTMFSQGATACQSGTQYRCDDGDWKALGVACSDTPKLSHACDFGGITYSTGSASCQSGTQYRCEDGAWASLGVACSAGDAPIRIIPSGRTCMYEGATVANGSTICRSNSTFLCNDGEWTNLGTLCR